MHKTWTVLAIVIFSAVTATAELQNIEVGGSIRIRGNYYTNEIAQWDSSVGNSLAFVEQRTCLGVTAHFTDKVSAIIELDSYDIWGEDFRSLGYVTGADARAASNNDVEIYKAYIEVNNMWDTPLRLRIGRMELVQGSEWFVGTDGTSSFFTGLSFDAIALTYFGEQLATNLVWAKTHEDSPNEEDGDIDIYAIYSHFHGIENVSIDGYWILIRDAVSRGRQPLFQGTQDVAQFHTVGISVTGTLDAFDYYMEAAYQFGNAERVPRNPLNRDLNDETDFDALGVNLEFGYTFDTAWTPRVYLGGAYLQGSDDEDLAFNRICSSWEYSEFIANTDMTNVWLLRGGVETSPTESITLQLKWSYFHVDEVREFGIWPFRWSADDELGWEVGLYATYNYTEDLSFEFGYAHLFVDEGLSDGNYVTGNGHWNRAGTDEDDPDYVYFETIITF